MSRAVPMDRQSRRATSSRNNELLIEGQVPPGIVYTGPELLGLVTLSENLGEDWNQQRPDISSELIAQIED